MTNEAISRVYYAASMAQAGEALTDLPRSKRYPVDVEAVRREAGCTIEHRAIPARQERGEEAFAILKAWASQ